MPSVGPHPPWQRPAAAPQVACAEVTRNRIVDPLTVVTVQLAQPRSDRNPSLPFPVQRSPLLIETPALFKTKHHLHLSFVTGSPWKVSALESPDSLCILNIIVPVEPTWTRKAYQYGDYRIEIQHVEYSTSKSIGLFFLRHFPVSSGRTDGWTDGPDDEFKEFFGVVLYVDNNHIVIRDRRTDGASGHGGGVDGFRAAISKVRNQYEKKNMTSKKYGEYEKKSTENPLIGRMCRRSRPHPHLPSHARARAHTHTHARTHARTHKHKHKHMKVQTVYTRPRVWYGRLWR